MNGNELRDFFAPDVTAEALLRMNRSTLVVQLRELNADEPVCDMSAGMMADLMISSAFAERFEAIDAELAAARDEWAPDQCNHCATSTIDLDGEIVCPACTGWNIVDVG